MPYWDRLAWAISATGPKSNWTIKMHAIVPLFYSHGSQ